MSIANDNSNSKAAADRITTLIFDVDDTLYDVNTKFTENRNGSAVHEFMVQYLQFPSVEAAKIVRDEYFERYHATAKGLQIAEQEGRFPSLENMDENDNHGLTKPRFNVQDLSNYWATKLDYSLLGGIKTKLIKDLLELRDTNNINLIAFSNGPRDYVIRVLQELGLWDTIFTNDRLFAVDDVLPYCKPEKEAFEVIFSKLGSNVLPTECIMIEDSMKNIRAAKALGLKTIFVKGSTKNAKAIDVVDTSDSINQTKDLAVDIAIETIEQLRDAVPSLWQNPAIFNCKIP
jgi:putative hydrolase of the HAD superfamily